jgi:hypothetical protein
MQSVQMALYWFDQAEVAAHFYAERAKARRIIPRCVGEELRALYGDAAKEALPTQLAVLLQRLDEAWTPGTEIERHTRERHLRQHSTPACPVS